MDGATVLIAVVVGLALLGIALGTRQARELGDLFETLARRRGGRVVRHFASYPELRLVHRGRPVLVTATVPSGDGAGSGRPAATLARAWLDAESMPRFEVRRRSLTSRLAGMLSRSMEPVSFDGSFAQELGAWSEDPGFLRRALVPELRRRLLDLATRWPGVAVRLGPVRPRRCDVAAASSRGEDGGSAFLPERPAVTLSVGEVLTSRADYELLIEGFLSILDGVAGNGATT